MTISQIKNHPKTVVARIDSEELYDELDKYFCLEGMFDKDYRYRILSSTNTGRAKSIDAYLGSDYFVIDGQDINLGENNTIDVVKEINRILSCHASNQEHMLFQIKRLISSVENK